ncbi:conserved hypothetical protein [synthetic Mycoplasma mycoides JCVI-syn1.0]|uniref:Uncharacterized protein n=1 Tax=Mycoplasma mycoides subsp. capri TaxID=40477 RepID=A0AB38GE28_MYCMC|nr:hypothetical protein [Mycoplasma mycoides]ADH22216.1 conserved hypothetical protein [synthetic Mycoplasma mycoides JCVI-syn1.0]AMW77015.1 hypothetical protein JCVISYN2_0514 [synthetic bacterium JCVI-Syn2.0]ACU78951.1 conserved hypothetical protein [Mycoplasma mycoides subsp. capri str. GM12]ACU79782.1 conserved hypothetical protein [Mycoplasma mycoides subsp. capri str. GM12]SRX58945.1 hypothetical protein MMC68K_00519 [Mycoplasma mycoides subsp. capri]
MKKLLFLLSNSVLFCLSGLLIYNLNSQNDSNNIVLKQENKQETDLSKIFNDQTYISIKSKDQNIDSQVLEALKLKYKSIDYSLLTINVEISNDRIDVLITPKNGENKYTNKAKISCYIKKDLSVILKDNNDLGEIPINNLDEIKKHIKNKDLLKTSFNDIDFYITNIREDSVKISATRIGDFFGEAFLKFNAKQKILSSAIYKPVLELKNLEKDFIVSILKDTYSSLKNEKLDITIDQEKRKIIIKTIDSSQFIGTVTLKFNITKSITNKPVEPKTTIIDSNSTNLKTEPKKSEDKNNNNFIKNNNTLLTIPNKDSIKNNKNLNSSNKVTGVIIGSTLGVVVLIGISVGSWFYFKKRK